MRSTEAACKYLSRLYSLYDDWYLALAAYNAGPGNVNRAIRRSGGKRNFWEIGFSCRVKPAITSRLSWRWPT